MKNKVLSITVLVLLSFPSFSQKDTCSIGLYINCLYDFNINEKSYMADFWMWMNYSNDSLQLKDHQDIPNSKSYEFSYYSKEKQGHVNWISQKCKAQMMHQWDVANYPFDKQRLRINIEEAEYDTNALIYIADRVNTRLDSCFVTSEWEIESFEIKESIQTYASNYGDPVLSGSSSYPLVVMEINIKRNHSWLLLLKFLTGAYVAFLISSLVFFVSSDNQDSRFGLCVGGLFAAISNKYITESVVPTSNANSFMDNVHNLTFAFILVIVIICIFSLKLHESEDEKKQKLSVLIDKISFWTVLTAYISINAFMIINAINK